MKEFDLNIGKILEDWEIYHAIREIIANALDEQLLTNTAEIEIVKKGNVVYVAHPLGNQYLVYGSLYHKRYMMEALNLVYGGGMLKVEGLGAQGRCTMIDQPQNSRYCINMVYASPVKRGRAEVIEDIMPIYNIKVSVKTDKAIKKIYNGLSGEVYSFDSKDDKYEFVLPMLECHTSIVAEY